MAKPVADDEYRKAVVDLFWDWYGYTIVELWTKEQIDRFNEEARQRSIPLKIKFDPRKTNEIGEVERTDYDAK